MKKFLYLFLFLSIIGCQSESGKIEDLIEKDLFEKLDDFNSYQAVNMSEISETYSSPYDNEMIYKTAEDLISCQSKIESELFILKLNKNSLESWKFERGSIAKSETIRLEKEILKSNSLIDSLKTKEVDNKKKLTELCSGFKKEKIGYNVTHKFRSKNKMGAFVMHNLKYYFDEQISKITKVTDEDNDMIEYGIIEKIDSAMAGLY